MGNEDCKSMWNEPGYFVCLSEWDEQDRLNYKIYSFKYFRKIQHFKQKKLRFQLNMASTKKGKKSKGVTISFQEFATRIDGDTSSGQNVVYAPKKPTISSWADEVEEDELITSKERIFLPTAPRASRGPAYADSDIPQQPPYQANLGNLNYDIDEEDIYKFFRDLDIVELKLPRDHTSNRGKGYGFVIFDTRADLIEALVRNETMLRGRPVRVALLNDKDPKRAEGGYERRGGNRPDRPPPEDEGIDNWRTEMRPDQLPPQPTQSYGDSRGYGGDRMDRNSNRRYDSDDRGDQRRGGGGMGMGRRYDDQSSRYPEDRGGPDESEHDEWRNQRVQPPMRGPSPSRDREGSRDYNNRRGPSPQHHEEEEFVRPMTVPREQIAPAPPRSPIAEPKQRKKLVLQPRTGEVKPEPAAASNYASIFGEAKPVDTFKRELEIEEKIEKLSVVVPPPPVEEETKKYRLLTRESSSQEKFIDITSPVVEKIQRPKRQLSWRQQQQPHHREEEYGDRQQRQHRRSTSQSSQERTTNAEFDKDRDSHSEPEDDRDFKQQQRYQQQQPGNNRNSERGYYDYQRAYQPRGGGSRGSGGNRREFDRNGGGGEDFRRDERRQQDERRGGDDFRREDRRGGGGPDERRGGDDFRRHDERRTDDFRRNGEDYRRQQGGNDFRGGEDRRRGGDDFRRGGDDRRGDDRRRGGGGGYDMRRDERRSDDRRGPRMDNFQRPPPTQRVVVDKDGFQEYSVLSRAAAPRKTSSRFEQPHDEVAPPPQQANKFAALLESAGSDDE